MSDLISRAEAKEALRERFKRIPTYAIWAMHIIDELPIHPTPSNTLGALDCVERQAAMKIRFSSGFDHDGILFVPYRDVEEHLKKLPSAQPEVIRCRECKYAEVADSEDSQDGYTCQFHRGSIWFSGSYCSWSERRTDE